MAQIHHFDHGWITPTVSYVLDGSDDRCITCGSQPGPGQWSARGWSG